MIDPQLCGPYDARVFGWKYPRRRIEPKLDGIRALCFREKGAWKVRSRNRTPLYNVDHVRDAVADLGGWILDGEVVAGTFGDTVSFARSRLPLVGAETEVRFAAFDLVPEEEALSGVFRMPLEERRAHLEHLLAGRDGIEIVPSFLVSTEEEAEARYEAFLAEGYEGAILKHPKAPYTPGRYPAHWMKLKPCATEEFPITGFTKGSGRLSSSLGAIQFSVGGITCKVGSGLTDTQRERIWKARKEFVGRYVEVAYQEKTPDGKLRFPRFCAVREAPGGDPVNL